jgi:hypothetical protein
MFYTPFKKNKQHRSSCKQDILSQRRWTMSTRLSRILPALCGILSAAAHLTSFVINQCPLPGSPIAQALVWGRQNVDQGKEHQS